MRAMLPWFVLASFAAAEYGGSQVAITQKFVDYATREITPEVCEAIESAKIPDQKGKTHSLDYQVYNIDISKASIANPSITFSPPNGLDLEFKGLVLSGSLRFYWREHHWPHVHSHGTATYSIAGNSYVAAHLSIQIENGKPVVKCSGAITNLDNLKIKIHGHASWLYNLLIKLFKNKIRHILDSLVSIQLTKIVNTKVNKALSAFSALITLPIPKDDPMILDETVTDIQVQTQGIIATLRGTTNTSASSPHPAKYPISPPNISPPASTALKGTHAVIQVSDYTLNSALYILFAQGRLEMLLPSQSIQEAMNRFPGNNTILAEDDGKLLNSSSIVTIKINATEAPVIDFSNDTATILAPVDAEFLLCNFSLFTLSTNISVALRFGVSPNETDPRGEILHVEIGSVAFTKPHVEHSNVGWIWVDFFSFVLHTAIDLVVPAINSYIKEGMSIPSVEGIVPRNTTLSIGNNVLKISTEVQVNVSESLIV